METTKSLFVSMVICFPEVLNNTKFTVLRIRAAIKSHNIDECKLLNIPFRKYK